MTLNDIVQKEEYSQFKLISADYDESADTTTLTFLYPTDSHQPTEQDKEKLKDEVQKFMGDLAKCSVKFRQSYIDNQVLFDSLVDFEAVEFPYLKGFFNKTDTHYTKENNTIKILLNCDKEMKDLLEKNQFCNRFEDFLTSKYYENIEIELNPCKQPIKEDLEENLSPQTELLNILNEEEKINSVEVDEVLNIVGKLITAPAVFIKNIKKKNEEVVIAGKVSNPIFSQFVPKSQKDKVNPVQKNKFTFLLTDASGNIEVIMFPVDKDVEKLKQIQEGNEVVVSGFLSEFANKTNLKADALSLCKVLTKEVKYIWREPIKDYLTIQPKPMVDLQQMDLFSMFEQKNFVQKNSDYWTPDKSVVVFDFETTGLNAENCEIIEIGAVKVTNGVCVETFSTLVHPNCKLPSEITGITGITDEMLVFAPTLDKVLPDFHKFTQGCVLSAYNIGFDIKFLLKAGLKYRYKFDNPQIDTLELARNKVASLHNYKLSSVVKALGVSLEEAHRALNDAVATAKVFIKLI